MTAHLAAFGKCRHIKLPSITRTRPTASDPLVLTKQMGREEVNKIQSGQNFLLGGRRCFVVMEDPSCLDKLG